MMRDGRWKVFRGACPNFEREARSWEWDEDKPGKPRVGQPCHALDAAGYACLIPVLGMGPADYDPLNPPGEDPRVSAIWRGPRKRFLEMEQTATFKEVEAALFATPFEEGFTVEDYEADL